MMGRQVLDLHPEPFSVSPSLGKERVEVSGHGVLDFCLFKCTYNFFTCTMIRSKSNLGELSLHKVSLLGPKL